MCKPYFVCFRVHRCVALDGDLKEIGRMTVRKAVLKGLEKDFAYLI